MGLLEGIGQGFSVALDPINLGYVFIGVLIGTVIGVLPGLGPTATIALLLPITYTIEPTSAIIMLAGIYYGSMYGGTITAVLLRLPGEAASVVTAIDGYQMARQGRAGPALGIAAFSSWIGGTVSVIGLTLLALPIATFAVRFGPPEMVALVTLGLLMVTYLGTGSPVKALSMAAVGLLLSTIGQDPFTGSTRFTFGQVELFDGLNFVAVAMGLFGVGEILYNLEQTERVQGFTSKIKGILPTRKDFRDSAGAITRGAGLGFVIGVLPGGGGVISSLASYATEKRRAKDPSRFGRGAIEGVAGPETANNASSTSAFIPLLTLGIPSNVVLALLFGALLIQGITPGPQLIEQRPDVFWGVIASMYIGNLFLLLLNVPLVGVFVQLLRVRIGILAAFALLTVMAGVFSINNDVFDMWIVLLFGIVGWFMKKTGFEPGPLVLAFVLGPILERSFRQSMRLSGGSFDIFITRPISGTIFALIAVVLVASIIGKRRKKSLIASPVGEEPAEGQGVGDRETDEATGGEDTSNGDDPVRASARREGDGTAGPADPPHDTQSGSDARGGPRAGLPGRPPEDPG